jgi:hypothetical protein
MKRSYSDMVRYDNSQQIAETIKLKTIKDLKNDRDELKKILDDKWELLRTGKDYAYDFLPATAYLLCLHEKKYSEVFEQYAVDPFLRHFYCFAPYNIHLLHLRKNRPEMIVMKNYRIKEYSALGTATMAKDASYHEKKFFIGKLRDLIFKPTPEDTELALLEKFERCAPTIIKQLHFFPNFLSEMPRELIDYVLTLTFWLKLSKEESLF